MWVNSGEVEDDGVDNDGNGYIDDIHGFNFVRLDNNIKWNNANDSGHGTHVAGIIAAMNNNNIGICGIAGGSGNNDGVRIMTIQIFYGNGGASDRNMAKAIQYAADNGAHILQNSWGYPSHLSSTASPANDIAYKRALRVEAEAIDYFVANGGDESGPLEGGLAIFAAGNDGVSLPGYPAAYEPCVAVASLSPSLRPAYYTCYGIGTDIAAPGGEALYVNGAILSTVPDEFQDPSIQHYAMMQGTSQACPHVSGVAALGLSYAKKLGKRYTANEFRSMLLSATNDIEPYLTGSIYIPSAKMTVNYLSYKGKMGAGYIDAYKLLLQIDGTPYTVVRTGTSETIDLAPYFGSGVHNAQLHQVEISDSDKLAIGFGECTYANGKLNINCSKSGVATITVTLLVGGGSLNNSAAPYPTKVSKSFVLMTKSGVASNNGWL
jgi:subtilisin family serine protease